MGARSQIAASLPATFSAQGEEAVYTPAGGSPVDCMVFIEFGVALQPAGVDTQVWQRGTTIEALLSVDDGIGIGTTEPNRDDVFTVDGTDYTVQEILENDGFTVTMVVT